MIKMKNYFCCIFLIVGCVGQKTNVGSSNIAGAGNNFAGNNNLAGKDATFISNNYEGITNNNDRGVPINYYGGGIPYTKDGVVQTNMGTLLNKNYKDIVGDNLFGRAGVFVNQNGYENNKQSPFGREDFKFELDAGNPDINAKIERPCEVYDSFCIRRYFAEHSQCRISGGPVPDPLYRAQLNVNYPSVNMSVSQTGTEYRGLNNARIEEFYINKATDNLIIGLGFDAVSLFSNNTNLKYYLRGREPVVLTDFGGMTFEKISITVIIPQLNDLRLDKAEINTFLGSPIFPYIIGPGLATTTDPEVLSMFAVFNANFRVDQQEAAFTEGNFYAATYIQYNICDFGLKVL